MADGINRYLHHIRARLRGKVDLIATEDIHAHPEGLVATKGDIINQQKYRNLSRLNLNTPLEESIKIAECVNANDLYKSINTVVDKDVSLSAIDQHYGKASVLDECCSSIKQFPELSELITALSIETGEIYEQSLQSAYFAYIAGIINKFSTEKTIAAFLAGLLQHIGLLFVKTSYLDKTRKLSADEWKDLQLHPIIAFKLLNNIEGFPSSTQNAILEHHERYDGSGYPMQRTETGISELGSLISLLDDVIVIHSKRFKPLNRSLQNILPVIQMNTFGYQQNVISAVSQAIRQAPEPSIEKIEQEVVKALIDYTYQQQLYINRVLDVINQVNDIVGFTHNSTSVNAIQNISKKIESVVASAGLNESSYVELLRRLTLENHEELHLEVEQTRLMLEEVIYQIQDYYNAANVYCNKKSNELSDKIKIFVEVFSATEKPPIPEAVKNYWLQLKEKK